MDKIKLTWFEKVGPELPCFRAVVLYWPIGNFPLSKTADTVSWLCCFSGTYCVFVWITDIKVGTQTPWVSASLRTCYVTPRVLKVIPLVGAPGCGRVTRPKVVRALRLALEKE